MDALTNSLTLDEIDAILSTTKQRGVIKPVLDKFFESGEVYINLSEQFPGKEAASLRNSVNINLEKYFKSEYNYRLVTPGEKDNKVCLLINMDKYAEQKAAENAEQPENTDDDE